MIPRLLLLCLLCLGAPLRAQEGSVPALDYLRDHRAELGVGEQDLAELRVTDDYASPSGVRHVYVSQSLYGTPVFQAQAAVHFRDGRAVYYTSRLEPDLRQRAAPTVPVLRADDAFRYAASGPEQRLQAADLVYYPLPASPEIRLAWQLTVEDIRAGTYALHLIDAVSGEALYQTSLTLTCTFGEAGRDPAGGAAGVGKEPKTQAPPQESTSGDGSLYHVYPFGVESPLFGHRTLVFEPADPEASPYGWHDLDAVAGPEYTYTRGNNAYAYRDADENKNLPDSGFVADGGEGLEFDFPFTPGQAPAQHVPASLTQLFYLTNMMHDWTYRHGFDEAAGNFQDNTYGRGGRGGDPVLAEAQDGSATNNANFSILSDGLPGRMQLFLWDGPAYHLAVTAPARLSGPRRTAHANFGPRLGDTPINGEVTAGRDAEGNFALGCTQLANAEAVRGKIVLLERGECPFQQKAYTAEQAGAIAVLIQNQTNATTTMGRSGNWPINIPALMLGADDGAALQNALAAGERVTVSLQTREEIPVDGSFDNGIVAHEYAHGLSTRLVGGPQITTCLLNEEQMGEGWSDFFLLASSPQAAGARPNGTEARGIGLYSFSGFPGERGFRTRPYATDLAVSDHTYDDIITAAVPHGVGEAWASMLWDVYWAMVDAYGFDEDLIGGNGGNNAAVRLVIEALKYTPCRPGYVDGRDALLLADRLENGGANQCLLWEAFRRRGLGFSAEQGSGDLRTDNREAFDPNPACISTLKLAKSVDSMAITPGDRLRFTLTLRNDKHTPLTELRITDALPTGTQLDPTSVTGAESLIQSSGVVTFTLSDLPAGEQHTLSYAVNTAPDLSSKRLFYDGIETENSMIWVTIDQGGPTRWSRRDTLAHAGTTAWYLPATDAGQDQILQLHNSVRVTGPRPALRFFTRYRTAAALDAGVLQLSTNGTEWEDVDDRFLRSGYRGKVDPRGPAALQNKPGFWGDSKTYQEVIVDLSEYRDQELYVRWRFLSAVGIAGGGWWIDEVEILSDLRTYNGEAAVRAAEGDQAMARVPELGVVIRSGDDPSSAGLPPAGDKLSIHVFPNPATETVQVVIGAEVTGSVTLELWTLDGRRIWSRHQQVASGGQALQLPLGPLADGTYSLRIRSAAGTATAMLTVAR